MYGIHGKGSCYYFSNNLAVTCDFTNSGLDSNVHNKIEEVEWNIGGHNTTSVYPNQIYGFERGINVVIPGTTCSGDLCNDVVERKTKWIGRIALAYPSDYGYAVDFRNCNEFITNYDETECKTVNWFYSSVTSNGSFVNWLLTPYTLNATRVYTVSNNWEISTTMSSLSSTYFGVSPTFYIDSKLGIISGNGSKENPYVVR